MINTVEWENSLPPENKRIFNFDKFVRDFDHSDQ